MKNKYAVLILIFVRVIFTRENTIVTLCNTHRDVMCLSNTMTDMPRVPYSHR